MSLDSCFDGGMDWRFALTFAVTHVGCATATLEASPNSPGRPALEPREQAAASVPAELSMDPGAGDPVLSAPSFQVLADGGTLITLQLHGPVRVVEQPADGQLLYSLKGFALSEPVNQLPLPTELFGTPVTAVELRPATEGAELVLSLRESARGVLSLRQNEGGVLLTVEVPAPRTTAGLAPRRNASKPTATDEEINTGAFWNGNLSRVIVGPRSPGLIVLGASMTTVGIVGLAVGGYFIGQPTPACDFLLEGFTLAQEDPIAAAAKYEVSDLAYDDCEAELIEKGAGALSMATGAAFVLAGVPVLLVGAIPTERTIRLGLKVYPAGAGLQGSF